MALLLILSIITLLVAIVMAIVAAFGIKASRELDGNDPAAAHRDTTIISVVSFILAFICLLIFIGLLYINFSPQSKLATLTRRLAD